MVLGITSSEMGRSADPDEPRTSLSAHVFVLCQFNRVNRQSTVLKTRETSQENPQATA